MSYQSFENAYREAGCENDDPLDNRPARNPYPNNWRLPNISAAGGQLAPDIHAKRLRMTRNWFDDLKVLEAGGEPVKQTDLARAARNTYALAEEMSTAPIVRSSEDCKYLDVDVRGDGEDAFA